MRTLLLALLFSCFAISANAAVTVVNYDTVERSFVVESLNVTQTVTLAPGQHYRTIQYPVRLSLSGKDMITTKNGDVYGIWQDSGLRIQRRMQNRVHN